MNISLGSAQFRVLIDFLSFNGFAYIFYCFQVRFILTQGTLSHWLHTLQRFPLFLASLVMLRTIIWLECFGRGNSYDISTTIMLNINKIYVKKMLSIKKLTYPGNSVSTMFSNWSISWRIPGGSSGAGLLLFPPSWQVSVSSSILMPCGRRINCCWVYISFLFTFY